jgi:hypothetical protein
MAQNTRKRGLPPPTRMGAGMKRTGKRKNAKSEINKVRDITYKASKILGDAQALTTGKVADRGIRRLTGWIAAQGLGSKWLK